jgi:hypothetical protein
VRPGMPANERLNAPAALQPVPAANGVESLLNGQDLGEGHAGGCWHTTKLGAHTQHPARMLLIFGGRWLSATCETDTARRTVPA